MAPKQVERRPMVPKPKSAFSRDFQHQNLGQNYNSIKKKNAFEEVRTPGKFDFDQDISKTFGALRLVKPKQPEE